MTTSITPAALPPYRQPITAVVAALSSDATQGLATTEAQARLERYGRNELPVAPPIPAWRKFLAQFQDPLTILLLIATLISFVAWIIEGAVGLPYEAITILAIVILNGVLGYIQEHRAEQAVAALRAAEVICAHCDAVGPIGAAMVYATAMGTIVRCPGCGEALIRIAHGPQRYWVDFSGTRLLQLRKAE